MLLLKKSSLTFYKHFSLVKNGEALKKATAGRNICRQSKFINWWEVRAHRNTKRFWVFSQP